MSLDNKKDMLKKKCKKCKKGRYYEWSFYCDRGDGLCEPLKCSECGHKTPRWIKKKKKKLEDAKKGLEKEIVDAILKEEYYMAHIMLKDLVEYKERRNTGG